MNKYLSSFEFNQNEYFYYDLKKLFLEYPALKKLPNSLKILLENCIRNSSEESLNTIIDVFIQKNNFRQIDFFPSRIIMQDYTGVPILVDLASIRDEVNARGGDYTKIDSNIMVDLVIDHSLNLDSFGNERSFNINLDREFTRNKERFEFLKWADEHFDKLSIVPPSIGVSHQLNLECLSTMICVKQENGKIIVFPEAILGTDSHTTMINSLGVLAWAVDGTEALLSMLDSHINIFLPKVLGVEIIGELEEGVTANDIVLNFTDFLKESNINSRVVEFFGSSLNKLTLEDRATISNMAPEYDAKYAYFSIDENTISYIEKTRGVDASLIRDYFKMQGLFLSSEELVYDEILKFDLSIITPCVSGPSKPSNRVILKKIPSKLSSFKKGNLLRDNDIVFAAINSCMSSSSPTLIIQAALLAKKAISYGLEVNTNIKKSFTPGSISVRQYLKELDLLKYFEKLGFNIEGFGCASCFGNSGKLLPGIEDEINKYSLNVSSVTSGNINYEGKIHNLIKSNWLMSPALVVAYALKGTINCNIVEDEISKNVFLRDIWPTQKEIDDCLSQIDSFLYSKTYHNMFLGSKQWQNIIPKYSDLYPWNSNSLYIRKSNIFKDETLERIEIEDAKILALLGNNIDTEIISPSGQIDVNSPAGKYLTSKNVDIEEFLNYGRKRANFEVMTRGIFSSNRLRNKIISPKEGAYTRDFETDEIVSIYDFAMKTKKQNTPLIIFAGESYGSGVPRDWAARGISLLGVKAVVAKSFDKNHRLNLISMGILPLEFIEDDIESLELKGNETITIRTDHVITYAKIDLEIRKDNKIKIIKVQSRLDSKKEVLYYKSGGVLPYFLKNIKL